MQSSLRYLIASGVRHASKVSSHNLSTTPNLPKTMKAVGSFKYLPLSEPESFVDVQVNLPELQKSDVLVEVKATAVNPFDTKQRQGRGLKPDLGPSPRILGYDGAGIVVAKGDEARIFNIGDEVFFTADLFRKYGTNAQYAAIPEILAAPKPKSFTFEQAAAMPLTTLTAYDSLFDRLQLSEKDKGKSMLIINSAGGVGSVASQLAKNLAMKVIGTASREETKLWSEKFGADLVLDHKHDLQPQLEANGYGHGVDYILVNFDPFPYWKTLAAVIKPFGKICLIVDSTGLVDIQLMKAKSVTVVSEMMLTRTRFDTDDKHRLHEFLVEGSKLFDSGKLKCTLTKSLSPINAANMKEAHKLIENNRMIGKLVLSGWSSKTT